MKTKIAVVVLALAIWGAVYQAGAVNTAVASAPPPTLTVPALLPTGMEDAMLLEAWIRLYSDLRPIRLWDGRTISGRQLALSLLYQRIPVLWDARNVCGGGACSPKFHIGDDWTFDDDRPGVEPIYVAVMFQSDMPGLVGTLAHEAFHRTRPFGDVRDSRFEEFWAYFVGGSVSPETRLTFQPYDPFDPGYLALWFHDNRIAAYANLPDYPQSILPQLHGVAAAANGMDGVPAAAYATEARN